LKTFESHSAQPIDEAFLGAFRPQAVIKEILADPDKEKKTLASKYDEYSQRLNARVAQVNAPTVLDFIKGKIGKDELKPEEVAKVVMKAKVVKQNDKGEWDDVGAYGGIEGGTGAEGGSSGSAKTSDFKTSKEKAQDFIDNTFGKHR